MCRIGQNWKGVHPGGLPTHCPHVAPLQERHPAAEGHPPCQQEEGVAAMQRLPQLWRGAPMGGPGELKLEITAEFLCKFRNSRGDFHGGLAINWQSAHL